MKLEGKKKKHGVMLLLFVSNAKEKKNYDWFRMGGVTIFISTV